MINYNELNKELYSLVENVPHKTANLANASALLYDKLGDVNWAGFYLLQDGKLVLGPFQGKPACVEISVGMGVCGTAVSRGETVVVENVHEFSGHIACDCASNSEIVVPIKKDGNIVGVLDIDSPVLSRFSSQDAAGLEEFVNTLAEHVF